MNTEWANSLLNIIPTVPFAWFGVSLVVWVLIAFILYQYSQYLQRKSTGVTTVKIRFDKKVFVDKVYELISTKARTYEDRSISTLGYEVATFTYPEYDWGPNNGPSRRVVTCFGAFTWWKRFVSRNDGRGWFFIRFRVDSFPRGPVKV